MRETRSPGSVREVWAIRIPTATNLWAIFRTPQKPVSPAKYSANMGIAKL